MIWLWIVLAVVVGLPLAVLLMHTAFWLYLRWHFSGHVMRIFQEKPLFIIPRGQPIPDAEEVRFRTEDGLDLCGCYLRTTASQRLGVILFGLEFGSNRWACAPYCERLRERGFDIFTFESRGQGSSPVQPGYDPLQWVTNHDVKDVQAALKYLKGRPDVDPRGVGFFGVSKGGSAGLIAAAYDPFVRCFVTDGIYATFPVVVPYMRKWVSLYSKQYWLQDAVPMWYYEFVGRTCIRRLARSLGCKYLDLEKVMAKLSPRPLLMIHGGGDTYIKPEMARSVFNRAREPKEFWLVENAKHNQAIQLAGAEYHRRVCEFFEKHLASAHEETAAQAAMTPPAMNVEPERSAMNGDDSARQDARRPLMVASQRPSY